MKTNSSRYLFLSLISLLTIGALAKESKPAANKSWDPSPTGVLAFLNTFDSVGDLLNGLAQMNLIQEHEKTAVLEVLKAKRIPVATKLVQGRVDGKRIHWGKKTLTIEGNGVFKTSDGTLIKVGRQPFFI